MRRILIGTVSAAALMVGTAWAQDTTTQQQPPAAQDQGTTAQAPAQPPPAEAGGEASSETDANVTIIEPQEGDAQTEEAETTTGAAQGEPAEAETDADVTIIEPQEEDAQAEEAEVTTEPTTEPTTEATTEATTEPTTEATTEATTTPAPSGDEVSADDMMGREVYGEDDQEIGEVTDVIVDPETNEVRRLVIGVGGFLGLGQKTVAIDMEQVEIQPERGIYVSGMTAESVEAMEEYNPDEATMSLEEQAPATPATDAAPATGAAPAPGATTGGAMTPPPATDGTTSQ